MYHIFALGDLVSCRMAFLRRMDTYVFMGWVAIDETGYGLGVDWEDGFRMFCISM